MRAKEYKVWFVVRIPGKVVCVCVCGGGGGSCSKLFWAKPFLFEIWGVGGFEWTKNILRSGKSGRADGEQNFTPSPLYIIYNYCHSEACKNSSNCRQSKQPLISWSLSLIGCGNPAISPFHRVNVITESNHPVQCVDPVPRSFTQAGHCIFARKHLLRGKGGICCRGCLRSLGCNQNCTTINSSPCIYVPLSQLVLSRLLWGGRIAKNFAPAARLPLNPNESNGEW